MDEEGLWTEDNLQPLEQAASQCRQQTLGVGAGRRQETTQGREHFAEVPSVARASKGVGYRR
jgi:hypothetical protein